MKLAINKSIKHKVRLGSKAGLAPGTIAYVGEERNYTISAERITYDKNTLHVEGPLALEDIGQFSLDAKNRWININGIHEADRIAAFGKLFGIHSLVLEDIVHTAQRPKLEVFPDFFYLVVRMMRFDASTKEVINEQLSIILKDNCVITFLEDPGDAFDLVRERLKLPESRLRQSGIDFLLYYMLDILVDNYFVILQNAGDRLEEVELHILDNPHRNDIHVLHDIKRELIHYRKVILPMRELIGTLSKTEGERISPITQLHLRDVYDHCVQVMDTLEGYRDISSGLMDLYLSTLSNKMNQVMKTLTIISTIFIPLTFIVGVYGMNFNHMPELAHPWAYPIVWMGMVLVSVCMLLYFKKKRWF